VAPSQSSVPESTAEIDRNLTPGIEYDQCKTGESEKMMNETMPRRSFDADNLILRVQKEVPGRIDAIPPVVEQIMSAVREMGCAGEGEFEIEVSLYEALANAVEHGCEHDPEKNIEVVVACDVQRGMIIIVRDPGAGFDPKSVPSPVVGENIYNDSGRGIFLINELMDEVRFEKGGTEIWMIKVPSNEKKK